MPLGGRGLAFYSSAFFPYMRKIYMRDRERTHKYHLCIIVDHGPQAIIIFTCSHFPFKERERSGLTFQHGFFPKGFPSYILCQMWLWIFISLFSICLINSNSHVYAINNNLYIQKYKEINPNSVDFLNIVLLDLLLRTIQWNIHGNLWIIKDHEFFFSHLINNKMSL